MGSYTPAVRPFVRLPAAKPVPAISDPESRSAHGNGVDASRQQGFDLLQIRDEATGHDAQIRVNLAKASNNARSRNRGEDLNGVRDKLTDGSKTGVDGGRIQGK